MDDHKHKTETETEIESLSPGLWGNEMWIGLYSIVLGYPINPTPEHIHAIINHFSGLSLLLPCKSCRNDYILLIEKNPIEPHVTSKDKLSKWLNRIHNEINKNLNKQSVSLTHIKRYFNGVESNPLIGGPREVPIRRKKCKKCKKM